MKLAAFGTSLLWPCAVITVFFAASCGPPPKPRPSTLLPDGRDPRDVYRGAVNAFKTGDYPTAYEGFSAIWAVDKKPKVAGNLGRTELKLKKYCAAVEHLTYFLDEQKDLPPDDRTEMERLRTTARWSTMAVQLDVRPDAAEVFVDGASVGKSPLGRNLCLDPGNHKLEARLAERQATANVHAAPGAKLTKHLKVPDKADGTP